MARYIDADALNEHKFQEPLFGQTDVVTYRLGWNDAIDAIMDNEPTVDVVEVVWCKDCDYSMGITEKKCPLWENIGDQNGYCKWWQSTTIFHK